MKEPFLETGRKVMYAFPAVLVGVNLSDDGEFLLEFAPREGGDETLSVALTADDAADTIKFLGILLQKRSTLTN